LKQTKDLAKIIQSVNGLYARYRKSRSDEDKALLNEEWAKLKTFLEGGAFD
jgi:hypothetical protein